MEAEIRVEEVNTAEELMEQAAEGWRGDGGSDGLGVVMDDLLNISERPEDRASPEQRGHTKKSCSAYSKTM